MSERAPIRDALRGGEAALRSSERLRVDVVRRTDELDQLAKSWELLFRANGPTIFQSFEWQRAWWRHLGEKEPSAELHVIVVRAQGAVVGIAPLYLQDVRGFGIVRTRRLAFMAREVSDYLDFIIDGSRRTEIMRSVVRHLVDHRHEIDTALFEELSDRSPSARQLQELLEASGVPCDAFVNELCPRTPLLATWEHTLASLAGDNRREIRRRIRNLQGRFSVDLEIGGQPETVDRDIDDFISMHQQRWTRAGRSGALASGALQAFHRETARAFAPRGWAFLAFLRVDGQRRAVVYGFHFRGELSIYLTGLAEAGDDLHRFSPGRVLASLCMQHAISLGATAYDFMRGTEQYKYELGAVDVANRTVTYYGSRAPLAKERYRSALLSEALMRRAAHEARLWRGEIAMHGAFSTASVRHVCRRVDRLLTDGVAKVRTPDRSLTAIALHELR